MSTYPWPWTDESRIYKFENLKNFYYQSRAWYNAFYDYYDFYDFIKNYFTCIYNLFCFYQVFPPRFFVYVFAPLNISPVANSAKNTTEAMMTNFYNIQLYLLFRKFHNFHGLYHCSLNQSEQSVQVPRWFNYKYFNLHGQGQHFCFELKGQRKTKKRKGYMDCVADLSYIPCLHCANHCGLLNERSYKRIWARRSV